MKRLLCVIMCVGSVAWNALPAFGQAKIAVYFDPLFSHRSKDCPVGGGTDVVYVVAVDANEFIVGAEYKVDFPPSMSWVADLPTSDVTEGTTATGIVQSWLLPQNGFFPVLLTEVLVQWNCSGCFPPANELIEVSEHPVSGLLTLTQWPDLTPINAVGERSIVCQEPVPLSCFLNCPQGDDMAIVWNAGPASKSPDIDSDGTVGLTDVSLFAQSYPPNAYEFCVDYDCSGIINLVDVSIFAQHIFHSGGKNGICIPV